MSEFFIHRSELHVKRRQLQFSAGFCFYWRC